MSRSARSHRNCRCGAVPGGRHQAGCDKEMCAICGGQLILCNCVYELSLGDWATMQEPYPQIWEDGPTEKMWKTYDGAVARLGGPLPWDGEFPGSKAAREFGLWCRMIPGQGWTECQEEHPEATEDLNRLHLVARWDRDTRRWVRRDDGKG